MGLQAGSRCARRAGAGMIRVEHGDCLAVLPALAAEGVLVDSVVCDPPYHLSSIVKRFGGDNAAPAMVGATGAYARASKGFMGKQWDGGDIAFRPETWAAVMAVMRPGAHLIAFSGSRTYHRMACAIEDAGFEIRDQLMWLYGSGFPKSHDISKGIDRAAGAEREVVGMSATASGISNKHGNTGGATTWDRVAQHVPITAAATDAARQWQGWGTALKPAHEPIVLARKPLAKGHTIAANVLAHGVGGLNIDATRIASGGEHMRGAVAGTSNGALADIRGKRDFVATDSPLGRWPANLIHDGSDEVVAAFPQTGADGVAGRRGGVGTIGAIVGGYDEPWGGFGGGGSAARFFYSSKADADDRCGSKHPTVKPTDLMAYLCRLVTPPGGLVLDPFAGSGSTGMACLREGFDAILIEREAEYVADIRRRIAHVSGLDSPLFGAAA